MKKLFFVLTLSFSMLSCKKDKTTPNSNNSSTATISVLDCSSVQIVGKITKNQVASNITVNISYTGGNGNSYSSSTYNSTGVSGLIATLQAGTLKNGNGTLSYTISGTATTTGTASFAINIGGQNCILNVIVNNAIPTSGYGPNITDVDGNTYPTVYIGTQIWMGKNLNVSHYNDNSIIPNITDNTKWANDSLGAYRNYNNNININNTCIDCGKLYNWYAISATTNGNKNVCPTGWHVPSMADWEKLADFLGGQAVAGDNLRSSIKYIWGASSYPNSYLFSAVPSGRSNDKGAFDNITEMVLWWSSDALISKYGANWGSDVSISSSSPKLNLGSDIPHSGFSVRCLKD